jgi:hypothetical protein
MRESAVALPEEIGVGRVYQRALRSAAGMFREPLEMPPGAFRTLRICARVCPLGAVVFRTFLAKAASLNVELPFLNELIQDAIEGDAIRFVADRLADVVAVEDLGEAGKRSGYVRVDLVGARTGSFLRRRGRRDGSRRGRRRRRSWRRSGEGRKLLP